MALTQQQTAAENARRVINRISAAASELGAADKVRVRVAVWHRDRAKRVHPALTVADAISAVNRAVEPATAANVRLVFAVHATFPGFYITDTDTTTL